MNFLSEVQSRGVQEALRALNLQALAGRPIEEVFLSLADYICSEGGTVDEGNRPLSRRATNCAVWSATVSQTRSPNSIS